ncbi:hypothetical protein Msi02_38870 [Microbispora siamensis]|uniref:Uncharacterized protein n=1 Tax=Microbispora siamensis TaxID=564413 RepID=A0ABQ4GNY0_9ACTN|nr:hypothetical protein Msi02_38870 [Microbispora siamensis]
MTETGPLAGGLGTSVAIPYLAGRTGAEAAGEGPADRRQPETAALDGPQRNAAARDARQA